MHKSSPNGHGSPRSLADGILAILSNSRPGQVLRALVRLGRTAFRRIPITACAYCVSALQKDGQNCHNCGAARPPPMSDAARSGQSTRMQVAIIAIWSTFGFIGKHCFAARRPLRGLVYVVAMLSVMSLAPSLISADGSVDVWRLPALWTAIGLTILWSYDGIQILRGRFF